MSSTRISLDYTVVSYDRKNPTHQTFIKQQLEDFNRDYAALCQYDYRSEALIAILGCTWFFGSLGTVSALFIAASYLGMSHELFGRPQLVKQFQNQLNQLYELYTWCLKSGGKAITDDKGFLELTKTILPLMEYDDLKKPLSDWNGVSEAFALLIVNDSLHRARFLKERQTAPKGFFSFFSSSNPQDDAVVKTGTELEGNSFSHRRQHAYAEARFLLYGRAKQQPQSMTDQASQWLGPIKALTNYSIQ